MDKYQQAWKDFQEKMTYLKKRQSAVLTRISEKIDRQKAEAILKKLKNK